VASVLKGAPLRVVPFKPRAANNKIALPTFIVANKNFNIAKSDGRQLNILTE